MLMAINAIWFLIGTIFGAVAIIVIACISLEGDIDRREEDKKNSQ